MGATNQNHEERRGLVLAIRLTIIKGIPIIHKSSMEVEQIRAFRNALITHSSLRKPAMISLSLGGSIIEVRTRKSCILGERARKWHRIRGLVAVWGEGIEGRRYRDQCIHITR